MASRFGFFISLLAFSAFLHLSDAHGAVTKPRMRGTLNTNSLTVPNLNLPDMPADNCPHCLNGGGKGAVILASNNNWTPWEPLNTALPFRHDSGLCGDPIRDAKPRAHEVGGKYGPPKSLPFVANYKAGAVIELTADITTNHNGYFEFFICDATKCGGDISEDCFKKGHCKQLMRVKTTECESQSSLECGPVDPAYPGRWYVPCRKGGHVGQHFMGGKYMRYQLPAGFKSNHAVLQWYWATANSCNPPGFKEYFENYPMPGWGSCPGDGGALGGRNPSLATCGGKEFPEEFWTCADVQVTTSGAPSRKNAANTNTPIQEPKKLETKKLKAPAPKPVQAPKAVQKPKKNTNTKPKAAPKKSRCARNWQQCGGIHHKGATNCCGDRYRCVATNKYYSQCKRV